MKAVWSCRLFVDTNTLQENFIVQQYTQARKQAEEEDAKKAAAAAEGQAAAAPATAAVCFFFCKRLSLCVCVVYVCVLFELAVCLPLLSFVSRFN